MATVTTANPTLTSKAIKPKLTPVVVPVAPAVPTVAAPLAATLANVPEVKGYAAGTRCPVTGLQVRVPGSYRFVALAVLGAFGTCPAGQYTEAHVAACNAIAAAHAGHKRMGGMDPAAWQLQLATLATWCRRSKWTLPVCATPAAPLVPVTA